MTEDERTFIALLTTMSQEEREALLDLLREIVESQEAQEASV